MTAGRKRRRPIHLLELGLEWPPDTFLQAKVERLAARGFRVTVACPDVRRRRPDVPRHVRLEPVVPTGRTSPFALAAAVLGLVLRRPGRLLAVVRAARAPRGDGRLVGRREALGRLRAYARLASLRPDVVHFEWNTAAVHFHSAVDALGCPSVVSVRGADLEIYPHGPRTKALAEGYPAAFRRAAAVHCVSEAAMEEALAFGLHPAKARIIRPAVDPESFRPASREPRGDRFSVVSIGWLSWRKGWEYGLRAIAELVAAGVPVSHHVVGAAPARATGEQARIARAIDDLGLRDHVTVHGPLEHRAVRELLQGADALLHTSLAEGIPNVLLEAMACGVPVVATDVGGTREVLGDGVEGFLVPPRDPRAAAEALSVLWECPERRETMGRAGRERVVRDLTLERQTDRWVALYEDVVAGSHRARPLRLLEVGLGWPPETAFLLRKLQGLAERGLEVRAAATLPRRSRAPWVADVALERLPYWADALPAALVGLAADGLRLLVVQPGRLRALLAARSGAGGSGSRRARLTRLRLHVRLARLRADVVHFEWASFAVECAPLLRVWPAATVVSCHGGEVMVDPFVGRGTRLAGLFGHVDAVHCVAGAVEQAAVGHGLPPARARVIPSAVNTRVFRPPRREPPPDGEFRVVTVAALRWVKGYEYALGAVARLAASGVAVRYEIAGAEPTFERGQLRRILAGAAELGLADRLVLHGHLEERKVVALLQQADVFLQASLSEGMPTAVLEAMACGVPVVATDVGGTREVLADGVEGFLVPARDAAAAAEALRALWEEPERRRTMGRAGRLRTEEFTLERQLDRFEALYRELGSP